MAMVALEVCRSVAAVGAEVPSSFKRAGPGYIRLPFTRLNRIDRLSRGCVQDVASNGRRRKSMKLQIRVEAGDPGPSRSNSSGDENCDIDFEKSLRLQTRDWRAFRAKLVKGAESEAHEQHWAHELVEPEKGCLLIAHPDAFDDRQTYFNQAVIFLFAHDEQEGSAGVILNRPTSYALGQIAGFEKCRPEFTDAPLYMGGDVGTNLILVIHGVPGVPDSKEVIPGVYLGGPASVKDSVKRGETVPNDYRWFLGYCGWRPGQLELEVAQGVWYLASGSKDLVTNQCIRLKRPLWRQVLELMGDEYSLISKRAYGEI